MGRSPKDWARYNEYQRTGKWPKKPKAPVQQIHDSLGKQWQKWAKENPDNAKYDNDGNPIY